MLWLPRQTWSKSKYLCTSEYSSETISNTEIAGVTSGVKGRISTGAVERHHGPARRLQRKIRFPEPSLIIQLTLELEVRKMDHTMNPERLGPSLLVFCVIPKFPAVNSKITN